jgi:hypothetical protein
MLHLGTLKDLSPSFLLQLEDQLGSLQSIFIELKPHALELDPQVYLQRLKKGIPN